MTTSESSISAWYINTNNIDVNQLVVAIDGRRGTGFNWYHSNGDLVKYFKWRPGQPDNSEFETQLILWKYYMNDYWNNGYTLSIYPTLFVCDQTPLKEQQENNQDRK